MRSLVLNKQRNKQFLPSTGTGFEGLRGTPLPKLPLSAPPPAPIKSATEMLDGGGRLENRVKALECYRCLFYCSEHRSTPLLASATIRISRIETAIETNFQLKSLTPKSQSL